MSRPNAPTALTIPFRDPFAPHSAFSPFSPFFPGSPFSPTPRPGHSPISPITPSSSAAHPTYSRVFTPRLLGLKSAVPSTVTSYSPALQLTHTLWFPASSTACIDPSCLLLTIYGHANIDTPIRLTFAIHHGPDSRHNIATPLPATERIPTKLHAELHACEVALTQMLELLQRREAGEVVRNVVMVTESSRLVHGISQGVYTWERNGWVKAGGKKKVPNRVGWRRVRGCVDELERRGVGVRFWVVGGGVGEAEVMARRCAGEEIGTGVSGMQGGLQNGLQNGIFAGSPVGSMQHGMRPGSPVTMPDMGSFDNENGGLGSAQQQQGKKVVWVPVMMPVFADGSGIAEGTGPLWNPAIEGMNRHQLAL